MTKINRSYKENKMDRYLRDESDFDDFIRDREGVIFDFDMDTVVSLLNQQDRKIKQLESQNKKLNAENQQLFERLVELDGEKK